jgi:hypothetical protein
MTIAQIFILLGILEKYGPVFTNSIIALMKKGEATIDDVEKAFKDLKPYEAYGIKDQS